MTRLSAREMLKYAEAVVLVQGSHPSPTVLLEHEDGTMSVVLLNGDTPPYESLPHVVGELAQLVYDSGQPLAGLGFAADCFVREMESDWDGEYASLPPVRDDPRARDCLTVWCCAAGGEPEVGQRIYDAKLQLDGSYDVTFEEPFFPSGSDSLTGRLDEMLRAVLAVLSSPETWR